MAEEVKLTEVELRRIKQAILATSEQFNEVKALANAQLTGGFEKTPPEVIAALITATATNYLAHITKSSANAKRAASAPE